MAQNFINSFFDAFEEYACKDYIATLYKITRSLSGKKINQDLPVKAADGTSITEEKAKLERWKKHFEQILNRPVPPDLANITEAKGDLDINLEPRTIDEIIAAIRKLKNNKAPGEDGICAEMLKQKRMLHQKFSIKYSKIYGKPRIFPKVGSKD